MTPKLTLAERFSSKYEADPNSGCWLWNGYLSESGYGRFRLGAEMVGAHRVSYELYCGPIPAGMHVMHKCDVRTCVNPAHLTIGTNADNVADRAAKGRSYRRRGAVQIILTHENRQFIGHHYLTGDIEFGARGLARRFGVSPGTIQNSVRRASRTGAA